MVDYPKNTSSHKIDLTNSTFAIVAVATYMVYTILCQKPYSHSLLLCKPTFGILILWVHQKKV